MTCYIKNTRLPGIPKVTTDRPVTKLFCIADTNPELLEMYLNSNDFYELFYLAKSPMVVMGGPTTYGGCYYNGIEKLPFPYEINEGTVIGGDKE